MKKVHNKLKDDSTSRFLPGEAGEYFEPVEDHQMNNELPEDHCHNDEAQTGCHDSLSIK